MIEFDLIRSRIRCAKYVSVVGFVFDSECFECGPAPRTKLFSDLSSCALSFPVMICERLAGPSMISRLKPSSLPVRERICVRAFVQLSLLCFHKGTCMEGENADVCNMKAKCASHFLAYRAS